MSLSSCELTLHYVEHVKELRTAWMGDSIMSPEDNNLAQLRPDTFVVICKPHYICLIKMDKDC